MTTRYNLYLDDERFPSIEDREWSIVRNADAFKEAIQTKGLPGYISFDHDLGEDSDNGYQCFQWFVEWCMDNGVDMRGVEINAHTANPVGRDNILGLLASYTRHIESEVETLEPAYEVCPACRGEMVYSIEMTNLFRKPMFQCPISFGCEVQCGNASIPPHK